MMWKVKGQKRNEGERRDPSPLPSYCENRGSHPSKRNFTPIKFRTPKNLRIFFLSHRATLLSTGKFLLLSAPSLDIRRHFRVFSFWHSIRESAKMLTYLHRPS